MGFTNTVMVIRLCLENPTKLLFFNCILLLKFHNFCVLHILSLIVCCSLDKVQQKCTKLCISVPHSLPSTPSARQKDYKRKKKTFPGNLVRTVFWGQRKNPLNLGVDPDQGANPAFFYYFFSGPLTLHDFSWWGGILRNKVVKMGRWNLT